MITENNYNLTCKLKFGTNVFTLYGFNFIKVPKLVPVLAKHQTTCYVIYHGEASSPQFYSFSVP